jgi:hypothetical protein
MNDRPTLAPGDSLAGGHAPDRFSLFYIEIVGFMGCELPREWDNNNNGDFCFFVIWFRSDPNMTGASFFFLPFSRAFDFFSPCVGSIL